jgi:hypothetical protein
MLDQSDRDERLQPNAQRGTRHLRM